MPFAVVVNTTFRSPNEQVRAPSSDAIRRVVPTAAQTSPAMGDNYNGSRQLNPVPPSSSQLLRSTRRRATSGLRKSGLADASRDLSARFATSDTGLLFDPHRNPHAGPGYAKSNRTRSNVHWCKLWTFPAYGLHIQRLAPQIHKVSSECPRASARPRQSLSVPL